ncbi:ParA family protein [Cupriavidus basilensis]
MVFAFGRCCWRASLLRSEFDLILFDTSPSLSHLTLNAMIAADGLLMPCPPDALTLRPASVLEDIFSELVDNLPDARQKTYDFVTIVYTSSS